MNQNIKNFILEGEKEFEEKFVTKHFSTNGFYFNSDSIGYFDEVQTQPSVVKQFISSRQISLTAFLIKMIVEEIKKNKMSRLGLNNKMKDDRFHDRLEINHDISVHNQALATILSKLKELIKE